MEKDYFSNLSLDEKNILKDIKEFCRNKNISNLSDLKGKLVYHNE